MANFLPILREQLRGTAFPLTLETQIRSICSKANFEYIQNHHVQIIVIIILK